MILAQVFGFLALSLVILTFQSNNRNTMQYLKIAASGLFFLHFALLGAWTGAVMNIITALRSYIFKERFTQAWAGKKIWLYLFIIIFTVAGILTWEGYRSLLPIIGMIFGTIAFWMKSPRQIRIMVLFASPCWIAYNLIVHSYPGLLTEILTISTVIIAMIRFNQKKKFLI